MADNCVKASTGDNKKIYILSSPGKSDNRLENAFAFAENLTFEKMQCIVIITIIGNHYCNNIM